MRLARILRLSAIGVALLAWLDPAVEVASRAPLPVDIAVARSALDAAPAANGAARTRADAADAAASQVVDALGGDAAVTVRTFDDPGRLPCDQGTPCVIVTDGTLPVYVPADRTAPTSVVHVGERLDPNVRVVSSRAVASHTGAEGSARVTLDGRGVIGRSTRVQIRDGAAVVGEAVHEWAADGIAAIDLSWWPLAEGTRTLDVTAVTDGVDEQTTLDNTRRMLATVDDVRWPVLVYERRPSWAVTFARRAIEADPRLEVDVRTELAPAVTAGTTSARLDDARLDRARVVVAGGLEALTADDVARLERYLRQRGGTLVLVPDRLPAGPITRLLPSRWSERVQPSPTTAGPLTASEWLVADEVGEMDEVDVRTDDSPTVVRQPMGAGRLVVVGAMDAWRERGRNAAFDRFWQGTVAELAQASGPPVDVRTAPAWARPGEAVTVTVSARSVRAVAAWTASARLACAGRPDVPLRLWPGDAPGTFVATARPDAAAHACVIEAAVEGLGAGTAPLVIGADAPGGTAGDTVTEAVERTGGLSVATADIGALARAIRALRPETGEPVPQYPMRSAWWLLPFVGCLGGEWWLRRRGGRR